MKKLILILLIMLFIVSGFIYHRNEKFENKITEVLTIRQEIG